MDYNAIAQKYGAVSSAKPSVDYSALASKFGAISSKSAPTTSLAATAPTQPQQDIGNQVGNFFKGIAGAALHTIAAPIQAGAELLGVPDQTVNDVSKKLTGGLVDQDIHGYGDLGKAFGRGLQTVALGLGPVAGGAAFGAGNSLEQGNNLLSVQTAFQTALGAVGGKVLDFIGKPLLDTAGKVIGKITPEVLQDVASKGTTAIKNFADSHSLLPEGVSTALNKVPDALENVANKPFNLESNVSKSTLGGLGSGIKNMIAPSNSLSEATGQVLQGETADIPAGIRTLQSIDTTGVKTQADLQDRLNSNIKPLAKKVDTELAKDTSVKKLNEFNQSIGKGKGVVKVNYVKQGIDNLKTFFEKTNDIKGLSNIKSLENTAKTKGLTYKDVNDLARLHGQEINSFNANGEAASGLSKQAAENTRTGMKNIVRQSSAGQKVANLDSKLSDLYDTKALVDKNVERVNSARQKSGKTGVVPRLIGKGIQIADTLSGSPLKAIGREIGTIKGGLSPLDIESNLAKNLKVIRNVPKVLPVPRNIPKLDFDMPRGKSMSLQDIKDLMDNAKLSKSTPKDIRAFDKMRKLK